MAPLRMSSSAALVDTEVVEISDASRGISVQWKDPIASELNVT